MSDIRRIGGELFAKDAAGKLLSRIGTVFPRQRTIVTQPGTHSCQRRLFADLLEREPADGKACSVWTEAVDLILEADSVLIRPDPDAMALAFEADELLQSFVPKYKIKFLGVLNEKVRSALKRRGECWRITPMPMSRSELKQRIMSAKIGIGGREIYYYNSSTGTRYLTYQEFLGLGAMDDAGLLRHLLEIRKFSVSLNPRSKPEIAFYMADGPRVAAAFENCDFAAMDAGQVWAAYEDLRGQFEAAVAADAREDNLDDAAWRTRMFSTLIAENDEAVSEELLVGLSPEFFMQIRWLPGGRIANGELMFDEFFEQQPEHAADQQCMALHDENAREFLYNLLREYDDLEYANIGRVTNSLSRRLSFRGRRDVYIAVIKQRRQADENVSIIRLQKWGVREHLDDGVNLLKAMYDSEEYTEYVLDRRVACRHLGMNISRRFATRRVCERYVADWTPPDGIMIWSPYFERPYISGVATDKIPRHRFAEGLFALRFARLLGMAAAANIIVGRCDASGKVLFDDGDEVLLEDANGMPVELVVADQTGTFWDFRNELDVTAPAYADPMNRRLEFVVNGEQFVRTYLAAFVERFTSIQTKFRKRRRAYESMFKNRPYDEQGSFAFRWDQVLKRLDLTNPREVEEMIRHRLRVGARC